MVETGPSISRLKEGIVKDALSTLCWRELKDHLDAIELEEGEFDQFLGYLRRCNELILTYPNKKAAAKRAGFFASLTGYIANALGPVAVGRLQEEINLLNLVEEGYHGILRALDRCDISQLSPTERVDAYVSRAAEQFIDLQQRWIALLGKQREFNAPQIGTLHDDDGNPYSVDGVLTALVECLTITLIMESYKNSWFDKNDALVLPGFEWADYGQRFKAGSTEVLAQYWRRWERVQERRRFLGGELIEFTGSQLWLQVPAGTKRIIEHRPLDKEFFDHAANERLNDRLIQTYLEMALESEIFKNVSGIQGEVALPPEAFVCEGEIHAAISLCEILGYNIATDQERPADLRLVEWLRGYSVLKVLATERHETDPSNSGSVCFILKEEELVALLERMGLTGGTAKEFVHKVTLKRSSRDLFDCPLVKLADGSLLVFGPGLISANHARIILSILSNLKQPLARKGKAFERDMAAFFHKHGLQAYSFKAKRGGEEYEYDLIVPWNNYLFLFECKNHSLSNHNPVQAYYFERECHSDARQVNRLVDGLREFPDMLAEHVGPDAAAKIVVPCVLNSLPFALPDKLDGVYFTDSSLIKRFFRKRNFNVKVRHQIGDNFKLIHRTPYHSWWTADKPSPDDLLRQLEEPFQLKLMSAHTRAERLSFGVSEDTLVVTQEFVRTEFTVETLAAAGGARASWVRKEIATVSAGVKTVRSRRERKLVRKQVRDWREKKKRET